MGHNKVGDQGGTFMPLCAEAHNTGTAHSTGFWILGFLMHIFTQLGAAFVLYSDGLTKHRCKSDNVVAIPRRAISQTTAIIGTNVTHSAFFQNHKKWKFDI